MRRLLVPLLLTASCGAPPPPVPPAAPAPPAAHITVGEPGGEVSRWVGGHPAWTVRVGLFPSTDPAWAPSPRRTAEITAAGLSLSGASDGSLVALDAEGHPLFQLGVRGPVTGIAARPGGDFEVSASATTFVGPDGQVREGAAAAFGEGADPPPWPATAAYRAQRLSRPDGTPFRDVLSVLALAPADVWVLAPPEAAPREEPPARLYHWDGQAWSDLGPPRVRFARERFAEGHPPDVGTFVPALLARGPRGTLLVVGARLARAKRLCVLERVGAGFRERRELFATVATLKTVREARGDLSYAVSPGGHEVLCVEDLERCVELGPGLAPHLLPAGGARQMPTGPESNEGGHGVPVLFAGETLWNTRGWGRGAADAWALSGGTLARWDGRAFQRRPSPLAGLRSAWSSGPGDLWVTGAEGLARFDGVRWQRILGIEGGGDRAYEAPLSVTGAAPGDVWVHGKEGLWHVTAQAGAGPDLTGTAAPPPPAAPPSAALAMGAVDPAYRLERVTLDVEGGPPLRHALGLAAGPGGLVWLHDGVRVVAHDGARARRVYQAPRPEAAVCWFAPLPDCEGCIACQPSRGAPFQGQRTVAVTAAGEGAVLADGLRLVAGGRVADPLALPPLLSLAASPSGALWAVSAGEDDGLPHALVVDARGLRMVKGLPPAAYVDVAPRADDEVWLAGALTSGRRNPEPEALEPPRVVPSGEGTLVRFDGHVFTRHRGPEGALLSVAAPAPGEAWAVGVAGGVVHVQAGVARAFHLEREGGARHRGILRGVAAAGPADVWMAGDGATLLRWDGQALRRVDPGAAGKDTTFAAVLPPGAQPGWVVGPGGIWRIVRVP
jgi:hypothetical protein